MYSCNSIELGKQQKIKHCQLFVRQKFRSLICTDKLMSVQCCNFYFVTNHRALDIFSSGLVNWQCIKFDLSCITFKLVKMCQEPGFICPDCGPGLFKGSSRGALSYLTKPEDKGILRGINRPLSHGSHFESQENEKLCFCTSSLALDERLDVQNLLSQHWAIKVDWEPWRLYIKVLVVWNFCWPLWLSVGEQVMQCI